jgi:hypothetical protein
MVTRLAGADGEARSVLAWRRSALARPCVATLRVLASLAGIGMANLPTGMGTRGYRTRMGRVWVHFYAHG